MRRQEFYMTCCRVAAIALSAIRSPAALASSSSPGISSFYLANQTAAHGPGLFFWFLSKFFPFC
jgi:hypothetical protein